MSRERYRRENIWDEFIGNYARLRADRPLDSQAERIATNTLTEEIDDILNLDYDVLDEADDSLDALIERFPKLDVYLQRLSYNEYQSDLKLKISVANGDSALIARADRTFTDKDDEEVTRK